MANRALSIGLGGDLMIGRLVDEQLAQVPFFPIWGDLQSILQTTDINIVNLETALTTGHKRVSKVFNFKADPKQVAVLSHAPIHAVNLANNHILDFSEEGLIETLQTLDHAHIFHVGAGVDEEHAKLPLIFEKKGMKIGLLGCTDNEPSWKATQKKPGTNFVRVGDVEALREPIQVLRKKVDLLILSIHWGPNMRNEPLKEHRLFAHQLIDFGVDIIHGHSAHVFQGMEVYRQKVILYDTGELVDDYAVDPILRNDRSFFFIVEVKQSRLYCVRLIPIRISNFQVNTAKGREKEEICMQMQKLSKNFQTKFKIQEGELVHYL